MSLIEGVKKKSEKPAKQKILSTRLDENLVDRFRELVKIHNFKQKDIMTNAIKSAIIDMEKLLEKN